MGTRIDRAKADKARQGPCVLCGQYPLRQYQSRRDDRQLSDLRDELGRANLKVLDLQEELRQARATITATERRQQAERDAAVFALADAQRDLRVNRTWIAGKAERQRIALNGMHVILEDRSARIAEERARGLELRKLLAQIAAESSAVDAEGADHALILTRVNEIVQRNHDKWGKP